MVRRGLEVCERLSPLCLYVIGRLAATLQSLYKHVSVHDVAKSIQPRVCTTHTISSQVVWKSRMSKGPSTFSAPILWDPLEASTIKVFQALKTSMEPSNLWNSLRNGGTLWTCLPPPNLLVRGCQTKWLFIPLKKVDLHD